MTPLLLALVVASQNPTVTFESRAERLVKLLPELSKAAGIKLEANGSIGEEVLMVRFDGVRRESALKSIASVCDGKWTPFQGGLRLTLDAEPVRRRQKVAVQERKDAFWRGVELLREGSPEATFSDDVANELAQELSRPTIPNASGALQADQYNTLRKQVQRTPVHRFLTRLLPLVDWDLVASDEATAIHTFAYPPNPLQRPFKGGRVEEEIRQFLAEQAIWSQKGKLVPQALFEAFRSTTPILAIRKVILTIEPYGPGQASLSLFVRDEEGSFRQLLNTSVNGGLAVPLASAVTSSVQSENQEVPLSPISRKIIDFHSRRKKNLALPMPPEMAAVVFNPLQFEPLGNLPTDVSRAGLDGVRNYVLNVPDGILQFAFEQGGSQASRSLGKYIVTGALNRKEANGILELRALTPIGGFQGRLARRVWQAIADEIREDKGVSVETRARAAVASQNRLNFRIVPLIAQTLMVDATVLEGNYFALKCYGLLSPQQIADLKQGAGIPYARMSRELQTAFRDLIVNRGVRLTIKRPELLSAMMVPSEIFPEGILPDTTLHAQFEESNQYFFPAEKLDENASIGIGRANPNWFAQRLYAAERPGELPWFERMGKGLSVHPGKGRKVTMKTTIGEVLAEVELIDDRPDFARLLSINDLPADTRKQIQAELEQFRKTYKNFRPETIEKNGPPPPLWLRSE